MKFQNSGKFALGTIGALAGLTGTAYMITDLTREEDKPAENLFLKQPESKESEGTLSKEEADKLKEEVKALKEENERAKDLVETVQQGSSKTIEQLEGIITSLTQENERVNGELAKANEEKEQTEEMYVDAAGREIQTREAYARQTVDYARIVAENNKLRSALGKHERHNPLVPKVGCWVAPDKDENSTMFGLNCPGKHPRNNGELVDAFIVTFAKKDEHPELFQEYQKYWEIAKSHVIQGGS